MSRPREAGSRDAARQRSAASPRRASRRFEAELRCGARPRTGTPAVPRGGSIRILRLRRPPHLTPPRKSGAKCVRSEPTARCPSASPAPSTSRIGYDYGRVMRGGGFKMRCFLTSSLKFVALGIAIVWITAVPLAAQTGTAGKPAAGAKAWKAPKTPWGHPDLQGTWTNTTTTPLERLPEAADKQVLTEEERADLARKVAQRVNADTRRPGQVGAYNEFWFERGTLNTRTSLLIDPPDGKVPAYTPAAQKRWDAIDAARKAHPADSWLDRHSYDRCITRGMPGAMMPGFYNHNYQILQTPNYVAIVVEMIHDARIIPLDGRPHLNNGMTQWLGDSRGHWEGDTLVVETTNLTDKIFERSNVV